MRRPDPSRRSVPAAVVTALLLGAVLVACGGGNGNHAQSPTPTGAAAHDAVLLRGRDLYEAHCARCHGVSGEGGSGPRFTGGKLVRDLPTIAEQLAFVHKRGIGRALTPTQLRAVVRYEREVLAIRG